MFTDRFIKVPCQIISSQEAEIVGENQAERITVQGKVNPFDISLYREEINPEGSIIDTVVVELRSGLTVVFAIRLKEFEALLNSHEWTR